MDEDECALLAQKTLLIVAVHTNINFAGGLQN